MNPIEYADAPAAVRAVYDDIKKTRNVPDVNNFWKYLARDPATLKRLSLIHISRLATFDRAQAVNVGKTKAGKTACYFREEGSSHSLDIGITADGAFIRLETFDSRETTPAPPLRVFAGKQIAKGEYATNEFAVLQAYDGPVSYTHLATCSSPAPTW